MGDFPPIAHAIATGVKFVRGSAVYQELSSIGKIIAITVNIRIANLEEDVGQ